MAQATLVGNQFDDGKKFLIALVQDGFDVTAASWIKSSDDEPWYLYVASKDVDDKGITSAYRAVHSVLRRMPRSWVRPFDVKLIGAAHPIAMDLLAVLQRHGGKLGISYHGPHLGGLAIEEALPYTLV